MKKCFHFAVVLVLGVVLRAQNGFVVDSGYRWRNTTREYPMAPGQLIEVFVSGIGGAVPNSGVRFESLPLPSALAGISVRLFDCGSDRQIPVPLFAVGRGSGNLIGGNLLGIILQVPYELTVPPPGTTSRTSLIVYENGEPQAELRITPVAHRVHVITTQDAIAVLDPNHQAGFLYPVVRHADGSLVFVNNPAKPGEIVTLWAVGLGFGGDMAKSGELAPPGITGEVGLAFSFGNKAAPVRPDYIPGQSPRPDALVYAGMVAGQIGVYQVNFRVPETPPPGAARCPDDTWYNLTVSVGYGGSNRPTDFDGASICVDYPPQP